MKKLLAILLAAIMVFSIVACSNKDEQTTSDDEKYRDTTVVVDSVTVGSDTFRFENIDSETVIISGFSTTNDKAHTVTIPAYLMVPGNEREKEPDKYLRVVGVGHLAFQTTSSIKTLVFPTEAAYRERDADFDINKHTFTIASFAFRDCVALEALTVPAYVTEIGKGAFNRCSSLKTLTFEEGSRLSKIDDSAFMDCVSLQSVTIPASVKSIGAAAFFACEALESVVVNEGTLVIGAQAFQQCAALASVKLPASLGIFSGTEFADSGIAPIGEDAFHTCGALYEEGWSYAGVEPEEPTPEEGVDKESNEYKNSEAYKTYEEVLAAYTAVMSYKSSLGLKSAD